MWEVEGLSIHEIVRRTGHDRNTVRRALRREGSPRYQRAPRPSKLDAFKDEIHRLLRDDARIPGKRVRELIEDLGYEGSKTILDDYLRDVRPLFERRRTYQRTLYRPGELLQFDLWEPRGEIPVGHGQSRRGWVVTAELGYSRAIAGALVFSKEAPDLICGMHRCLGRLGALPQTLVWDREGAIHAGGGQPTDAFAGFCGALTVGWLILEARDPEAKGALERSHRSCAPTSSPAAASPTRWTTSCNWTAGATGSTRACIARRARSSPSASPRNASGCAGCRSGCPTRTGASSSASRSSPTCASTPTTTRWTRAWPAVGSRCASRRPN